MVVSSYTTCVDVAPRNRQAVRACTDDDHLGHMPMSRPDTDTALMPLLHEVRLLALRLREPPLSKAIERGHAHIAQSGAPASRHIARCVNA